jgi:hypothetical protein
MRVAMPSNGTVWCQQQQQHPGVEEAQVLVAAVVVEVAAEVQEVLGAAHTPCSPGPTCWLSC